MNVIAAAKASLDTIDENLKAERDPAGDSLAHAKWMLRGIREGYIQHEKAHRWLGYAQALIVVNCCVSLKKMKEINRDAAM